MTPALTTVTGVMALLVTAAALLAGLLTLAAARRPPLALGVCLDLLLGAGLLRLAGDPSWQTIATAAAVVALRRLIGVGLRLGGRTWTSASRDRAGSRTSPRGALLVDRLVRPAWRS